MKCIRVLEYEGPREWIEQTLNHPASIHGEIRCGPDKYIREISVTYEDKKEERKCQKNKEATH